MHRQNGAGRNAHARAACFLFTDHIAVHRTLFFACLFCVALLKPAEAVTTVPAQSAADASDWSAAHAADRRLALVIGNGDYRDSPLGNPVHDARSIGRALQALGFDVMRYENLSQERMTDALAEFERRLAAGGTGVFYFAGHGFDVAGNTLLAPVDARTDAWRDLLATGVGLRTVLQAMSAPRPGRRNLVILDSCRNELAPLPLRARSASPLLLPDDTLIAYATAPGAHAADGARHGIHTAALLQALAEPAQDVAQLFAQVQSAVQAATGARQTPRIASSLPPGFRLAPAAPPVDAAQVLAALRDEAAGDTPVVPHSRAILPKDSAEQYELTFWDSIKDSKHIGDYEAYLNAYPKGRFAALARARIERLRAEEKARAAEAPRAAPEPKAATERPRAAAKPPPAAKTPPAERARPAPQQARPAPAEAEPPTADTPPSRPVKVSEAQDCPLCPALVMLPAGSFMMGSNASDPSEKPAHRVTIGKPFAIGKTEVTVEQWSACVAAGACQEVADASRPKNTPVRDVSWDDAQQYLKWLSQTTGKKYRLPTEAEWEYAARGGTATHYWWGERMRPGNANCKECGDPWNAEAPAAAGSFAANPYGLHDVNGSVWEWVSDCWHNSYKGAPADGSAWDTPACRDRVIRGGSWREDASYMLSSTRFKYSASVRHSQNGFRVARDAQ